MTVHEPVMLKEVLEYLAPKPNGNFVDCTFGGGGHSLAILKLIRPNGQVVGIDWDPKAVTKLELRDENLLIINENYRQFSKIVKQVREKYNFGEIDGILMDLGYSSDQLEDDRGFSFQKNDYLDLRYNPTSGGLTGADIIRTYSQKELFELLKKYGEETLAWDISKKIVWQRENGRVPETADMLVQLVSDAYRRHFKTPSKKNPSTKVFQALRIAVNDEYGNILATLPQAIAELKVGGRLAVITFHSGEDKIVKSFFSEMAKAEEPKIKLVNRKAIEASIEEVEVNPRSRSAKLRVVEKINQ